MDKHVEVHFQIPSNLTNYRASKIKSIESEHKTPIIKWKVTIDFI